MKVQRVYVDTSVIGGCFDEEFAPWSKGLMRHFREGHFVPVVSAPQVVQEQYLEILAARAEVLSGSDASDALAARYQAHGIVPESFAADAEHIALATVSQVDLLVSWNFKHIVRFDKIRLFGAVNREMGYKEIEIYSPREVTSYEER